MADIDNPRLASELGKFALIQDEGEKMTQSLTANQQDHDNGELVEGSLGKHGPELSTIPGFLSERQKAEVSLKVTRDAGFSAKAAITNGGLLSIAVLVSSILLSTAVLVHVAVKGGKSRNVL